MGTFVKLLQGAVPLTGYPYVGVNEPCNLCGSSKKATLSEYDRRIKKLRTVICLNCGLHRTDPMPTQAELSDYYRLSYRFDYQLAGTKPPKFHLKRSVNLAEQRLNWLSAAVPQKANVLDFGCGSGEFLKACKDQGHQVTGIEPGQDYANFANETYGVNVKCSVWSDTDLGDEKFDLITSFHVFEHLRDPLGAMKWLVSHLAKDGVITIAVPNMIPHTNGRKMFERLHFAHVHGFTPVTLELLGRACNLELDPRVQPIGTDMVFRKSAKKPTKLNADPAYAQAMSKSYGDSDMRGYFLTGRWIADAFARAGRDIRDSFKPSK